MKRFIVLFIMGILFMSIPFEYAQGAISGTKGKKNVLVVLVDFSDRKGTYTAEKIRDLFFSTNKRSSSNPGSVREYFRQVSYNQLDLTGDVTGWKRAPKTFEYYLKHEAEFHDWIVDSLANGLDIAKYDADKNKVIDGLIVVVPSRLDFSDSSFGAYTMHYPFPVKLGSTGYKIQRFCVLPEMSENGGIVPLGAIAHEYTHALGIINDLYDTDYSSRGIGSWGLMGTGAYQEIGTGPCFVSAWTRKELGWAKVIQLTKSQEDIEIKAAHKSNVIYQIGTGKQYFLIENRQNGDPSSFDEKLPGSGLLVWFVDERQKNNNNEKSKLVTLKQGDGRSDLENNVNDGDEGDPLSKENGEERTFKGGGLEIRIYNISESGDTMTFSLEIKKSGIGTMKLVSNNIFASLKQSVSKKQVLFPTGKTTFNFGVTKGVGLKIRVNTSKKNLLGSSVFDKLKSNKTSSYSSNLLSSNMKLQLTKNSLSTKKMKLGSINLGGQPFLVLKELL